MPIWQISAHADTTSEKDTASLQEDVRQSSIEDQKETEKKITSNDEKERLYSKFGVYLSSSYRYYKNIDSSTEVPDFLRWSFVQDFYAWMYLNYDLTHSVYVRTAHSYIDRGVGEAYTGIGADTESSWINAAFYRINLTPRFNIPFQGTFGRQNIFVGRGIAYYGLNDGVLLEYTGYPVYIKGFFSHASPRQDNIDFSVPGFDKEGERIFWGLEAAYLGIPDTAAYGYGVMQKDLSAENTDNPAQDYHYNSYYLGTGFSNKTFKPAELWSEFIYEHGNSFTDASRTALKKTKIDAYAFVSGVKIKPEVALHPVIESEFAYGSGDEDRLRVTNTTGGDIDGKDKNFLYFGSYHAGYALQPRLSNIYLTNIGASFRPFEWIPQFKRLAFGTKYYFYWKEKKEGLISDFESTGLAHMIGQEADFYLHWNINDNLGVIFRYGIFMPSDGFGDDTRDPTEYFFTSVTTSF